MKNKILLSELTWPEAEIVIKQADIIMIPLGSTEQHGLHLPLSTDIMIAEYVTVETAKKAIKKGIKVVVTPPIYFGFSQEHNYPGTIGLKPETLIDLLYSVCTNLIKQGAKRILIVNGHGGNQGVLDVVSRKVGKDHGVFVFWTYPIDHQALKLLQSDEGGIGHAGELETAVMLIIRPDLVVKNKILKEVPDKCVKLKYIKTDARTHSKISFGWFRLSDTLTDKGTIGDPTKATADVGKEILQISINALLNAIQEIIMVSNTLKQ